MGFESFTVLLTPCDESPLQRGQDAGSVARLAEDIQRRWPSVRADDLERDEIAHHVRPSDIFLFSETEAGLYQMLLQVHHDGNASISLRFALCNPRSVYAPFCAMVSWLMECYQLRCCNLSYVPPTDSGEDFCDARVVAEALTPSMDENRRLWQLDADMQEEQRWRPGEALAWFVRTRCVPA
ncbi:MAG: hypothetical protein JO250_00405 [Armatimonadetes bacterium]|nr:hypothetical protein [Armatimonadota bacterium]